MHPLKMDSSLLKAEHVRVPSPRTRSRGNDGHEARGVSCRPDTMSDLHTAAKRCLDATDPAEKLRLTHATWEALQAGELHPDPTSPVPEPIDTPGRPALPRLVPQRQVPHRGLGTPEGRAALVHAVAHIEFNAINLAW